MQTLEKHRKLVENLVKPGEEILSSITPKQIHELHMVVGLSGEAGELLDAVKKYVIYNKPLDVDNVIEELGDLEFFMEGLRQSLGLDREMILQNNIEKLSRRYPQGGYSDQAAQDRLDKSSDAPETPVKVEDRVVAIASHLSANPLVWSWVDYAKARSIIDSQVSRCPDLHVKFVVKGAGEEMKIGMLISPNGRGISPVCSHWIKVDDYLAKDLDRKVKWVRENVETALSYWESRDKSTLERQNLLLLLGITSEQFLRLPDEFRPDYPDIAVTFEWDRNEGHTEVTMKVFPLGRSKPFPNTETFKLDVLSGIPKVDRLWFLQRLIRQCLNAFERAQNDSPFPSIKLEKPKPYGIDSKKLQAMLGPYRTIFKDLTVEISLKHNKIEIGVWRNNSKGRAEWCEIERQSFDQLDQEDKLERIEYYVKKALGVEDEEMELDENDLIDADEN